MLEILCNLNTVKSVVDLKSKQVLKVQGLKITKLLLQKDLRFQFEEFLCFVHQIKRTFYKYLQNSRIKTLYKI